LIVDDEAVFRASIRGMLDWGGHGFHICGEADSGLTAKQLIETLRPEIVITDICMAEADGLALITLIRDHYPQIQVIALSGYDNYEYVRESLKKGVVDYLLKHRLNSETLLGALRSAEQRLSRRDRRRPAAAEAAAEAPAEAAAAGTGAGMDGNQLTAANGGSGRQPDGGSRLSLTGAAAIAGAPAGASERAGAAAGRRAETDDDAARRQSIARRNFLQSLLRGEAGSLQAAGQMSERLGMPFLSGKAIVVAASIDDMNRHKQKYGDRHWWDIFNKVIDVADSIVAETADGAAVPMSDSMFSILFCSGELINFAFMAIPLNINVCKSGKEWQKAEKCM
jgi:CheY-like chemotaxis protein